MRTINRGSKKGLKVLMALFLTVAVVGGWAVFSGHSKGSETKAQTKKTIYTCAMHPQIRRDKPGDCPICGMKLIPVEINDTGQNTAGAGSGAPEALQGLVSVRLSPYKQQLIGVRFATVEKVPISRVVHTNGRFAGGMGDFAALAGDFAAQKPLRASGRYVVADVYALDLPFVKVGQKAVVTDLSGSGNKLSGRVSQVYPYDQTQSRVIRVKITLFQAVPSSALFANVDIEAVTEPRLAVPPTAVMDTGNHRYVFLQTEPGTFTPREITVGYQGSDLWEVASGLKAGDQVVDGANFLIDADSKLKAAFAAEK
jgi:hypothetical protein